MMQALWDADLSMMQEPLSRVTERSMSKSNNPDISYTSFNKQTSQFKLIPFSQTVGSIFRNTAIYSQIMVLRNRLE